ncbi:MAG TPA: transcriptional regulator [Clostridiaceae bacterium]|nr:transcriptional regulator [Clostridiaceae bacterium]
MKRIDNVYKTVKRICLKQYKESGTALGVSASGVADILKIQRANASSDLNKLFRENKIEKLAGKPVLYKVNDIYLCNKEQENDEMRDADKIFEEIIGANSSLKNIIQQAKAAIIYPPNGLHTLLCGETGTGKSMLAEAMYNYAKQIGKIRNTSPFVTFNCADYANNPQLLMAQLFGVKKGAYTGAEKDRMGLVEKANGGILFLDEVHRLPPEGQEMLFFLVDKGVYKRLGDPNKDYYAKVLIICATTEDIKTALLQTFTRRIPMVIKLPSLMERTLEERYQLIIKFFTEEAICIKSSISVTSNALKALLLYDCPNNIGQLKSDIKICCARAFLQSMMNRDNGVCVHSEDLPEYTLSGALKYKQNKDEVDKLIVNKDIITFGISDDSSINADGTTLFNFYNALEEKKNTLESKGLNKNDIKLIMSLDIDTYLKRYVLSVDNENLEELYKVVDKKIVNIVEKFLKETESVLNKNFSLKIVCALSMHLASTIERIKSGEKIENSQLESVKREHGIEFKLAEQLKNKVKEDLNIILPEDEIGFITMFLCMDEKKSEENGRVGVLVAMHGESAATSIADVVNRLLKEDHVVGYNMRLEEKPEATLKNLITIVNRINEGKGIVFLVDMGLLAVLGDMIYEKTKVPIKTIEMVSTPMVLEAASKALMNSTLDDVYNSCINISPFIGRIYKDSLKFNNHIKQDIILTACITGQGSAIKLKSMLEQRIDTEEFNLDIIPIEILDKLTYKNNIQRVKDEKDVLAIVSPLDPNDPDMIYISTSDVFSKHKLSDLNKNLNTIKIINNMEEVINETIDIDAARYIKGFKKFYIRLCNFDISISESVIEGLILHIGCAVERVLKNNEIIHVKNKDRLLKEHMNEFEIIKDAVKPIEDLFYINFSEEEYLNIMKIVFFL